MHPRERVIRLEEAGASREEVSNTAIAGDALGRLRTRDVLRLLRAGPAKAGRYEVPLEDQDERGYTFGAHDRTAVRPEYHRIACPVPDKSPRQDRHFPQTGTPSPSSRTPRRSGERVS
jgi:hypothetical protein